MTPRYKNKNNPIFLLFSLLIIFPQILLAQNQQSHALKGYVYNELTKKPISNANVKIGETSTVTDKNGYYLIKNIAAPYQKKVKISYVGFVTIEKDIDLTSQQEINFYLIEQNHPLADVVVTATRTQKRLANSPVITQVITSQQIEDRGVSDIRNLLMQEVPGLQFQEVGFGTSINMQGISGKHILFLIDGERLTGETGNNIDYGRLVISNIERIEIIQGASSSMYGSQAMGGVINIITKKANKNLTLDIGAKYIEPYQKNGKKTDKNDDNYFFNQSIDKQNIDAHINIGLKLKQIRSYTSFSYKTADGYELYDTDSLVKRFENLDTTIHNPLNRIPTSISGYQNKQLSQRLDYDFSKRLKIYLKGSYYDSQKYDFNSNYKYEQNLNVNILGGVDYVLNKKTSLRLSVNADQYDKNQRYELFKDRIDKYYKSELLQPRLLHYYTGRKHQIVSGIEYSAESLYGYQFSDTDFETKSLSSGSIFSQDDWQINTHLNLTTGLRIDYNNNYGIHITPKLSILYKLFPFNIRFNYAHGYRAPGLKDLYINWDHLGMFRVYGNQKLQPETNHYFSISAEYINPKIYLNVMAYTNQFRDKIEGEWRNNQKELHYVNMSTAMLAGANINTRFNPIENLYIYATANYMYPDKNNTIRLTTNSTWTGNARMEYKIKYANQQSVLNLMARYVGEKKFHVADEIKYQNKLQKAYYMVKIPQYTVLDLTLTQYIGNKLRATIGVDNLLDYKAGIISFNSYVSPGRKVFIALNFTL